MIEKSLFGPVIKVWFPLAVLSTLFCGLVYATVQQNYRQSANDPQIQIAQDTVATINSGFSPKDAVFRNRIDISKSLAPYIIIYDASGKPIVSGAVLDDKTPNPPKRAFDSAKKFGENRFTWEPKNEVRSAVVLAYYKGKESGFVLAGRSLREIEMRKTRLEIQVGVAWIVILVATLAAVIISESFFKNIKFTKTKAKK